MQPSMNKRWRIGEPMPPEVDQVFQDYPPFLRAVLYNRGFTDLELANRFLTAQSPENDPFLLKDMDAAVERLLLAADRGEHVAVYGDYDVDGVTATVLMTQVLRAQGIEAQPYIPNRFEEGYGLNCEALDTLAADGVKVVLTVDCGIRSNREVEHGVNAGLDMIVSDHHSPLGDVPRCTAVICQRQPGDGYLDKNLAGVGLAYKIAQALFMRRPVDGKSADDWLDLVALGTVADVVPLVGENRALVRAGIRRIRRGARQGLLSLAGAAGMVVDRCTSGDIGFMLGPRLNAAGRLESALASVNLLLAEDVQTAGLLAQKLDDQNRERQTLTRRMQGEAEAMLQESSSDLLITAFHAEFNSGVVGLVAARLAESYYRPAIVGQIQDGQVRASCRSIDEFHITRALDECADLMVRHGGHAKAAGFTVRMENLPVLVERMQQIAARELSELDLRPVLRADLETPPSKVMQSGLFNYLDLLEPTGMDNPEVVFVSRNLLVKNYRTVGAEKTHLKLTLSDGYSIYDAIAFRQGHWAEHMPERLDLLYTFERNFYNGRESLQLNVRDLKPAGMPD